MASCYIAPMFVVDPWHWLTEEGDLLRDNPRLYRRMLRVARVIEYGGTLKKNETRETLLECARRPMGKACPGLMWVMKNADDGLLAYCVACKTEELLVHNWQGTEWANGMMVPVRVDAVGPALHWRARRDTAAQLNRRGRTTPTRRLGSPRSLRS